MLIKYFLFAEINKEVYTWNKQLNLDEEERKVSIKGLIRKGIIGLLIVLLTTQGWYSGVGWKESTAYADDDLTGLGIESTIPALGARNVDSTLPFSLVFKKPVRMVAGTLENISIYRLPENKLVAEVPVNTAVNVIADSADIPGVGKVINFQLNEALKGGHYAIRIGAKSFEYGDNEPVDGLNEEAWSFYTLGLGATTINSLFPNTGAASVNRDSNLQVTFSNPIDAGVGEIVIYEGGVEFEKYDMTLPQSRVVISGNTLTIDPVKSFSNNATYSVNIDQGALRDKTGNDVSGTGINGWQFTVFQSDPTSLVVSSLLPSNGASGVALTGELAVTFNKELDPRYPGSVTLRNASGSVISASTSVNSSNHRQLRIIPSSSLASNTSYTVDIPGGVLRDKSGNLYTGLNGATSWTFRTLTLDRTAPVLKTSKMYSNTIIRLTYDKLLSSLDPLPSSFSVTVNGESRSVSTSYVSGDSVYVVLDTGVAVGQVVRIGYSPGSSTRKIQDLSLNSAAAFGARDVENSLESIMSKPREGSVYNSTLNLYYPETVYINSSEAYKQFSVTADGTSVSVSSMSTNNSSLVTLNLSRSITNGEVVRVSYQPGDWAVKDSRGQALAGFSEFYVRNSIDTKNPEFQSAEVSGNKLWIRYNEPLSRSNKPLKSQYSVLVDGKAVFVNDSEIEDDVVALTLASPVTSTQTVTLSYVPGTSRLTDLNGNPAGYLNLTPVTYTYGNGTILSGVLQGDTILINFRNALKAESTLSPAQFSVQIGNNNVAVSSASASGSVVTLKLPASATAGQTGTVSYTPGAVSLRDALNIEVVAFGPLTLQVKEVNTSTPTTPLEGRPSWISEVGAAESGFGQSMYIMNSDTAAVETVTSRNNRSTRQFTIDETKLAQAFEYAYSSGKLNQPVMFEVPESEATASVGIPFHTLSRIAATYRTGSFGIKYSDSVWLVPLSQLEVVAMGQSAGITTAPGTAILYVQLEALPIFSLGTLEYMLTSSNAQRLANVTEVHIELYNGNTGQTVEQNIKSQFWMQLPGNTSTVLSGFTAVDSNTQTLSYVPTTFRTTTSGMVARGKLNGNQIVAPVTHLVSFPNAKPWARDAITELASKWIISADNLTAFKPDVKITRAEFAELVAKGLGLKGNRAAAQQFRDLNANSSTYAYIGAAVEAKIIEGVGDNKFQPNRFITREQMAIMLMRAMNYAGQSATLQLSVKETLSKFTDEKSIKSKDTVAKAVQTEIINGVSDTEFKPLAHATRAQAAVMLKRMLNRIGYL